MLISQRLIAVSAITCAFVLCAMASFRAQQPVPLKLSAPAPHVVRGEPGVQAEVQTQTAQGELLDVDARASTVTVKTQAAEMTFRFNEQTKVTGAQKGVSGLATMTGSQVTVMYRKDGQLNLATSIDVKAAK